MALGFIRRLPGNWFGVYLNGNPPWLVKRFKSLEMAKGLAASLVEKPELLEQVVRESPNYLDSRQMSFDFIAAITHQSTTDNAVL